MPKTTLKGEIADDEAATVLLRQIETDLRDRSVEYVQLQAAEHAEAVSEGRSSLCDYILEVSVKRSQSDVRRNVLGDKHGLAFAGKADQAIGNMSAILSDGFVIFDYKLFSAEDGSIKSGSTLKLRNAAENRDALFRTIAKMADTIAAAVN